ncbi:DUF7305 domain-containing protein [Patulibacter medicamentivorans]|nr:hypothetical protein [Patulibacter medicamentivorans]
MTAIPRSGRDGERGAAMLVALGVLLVTLLLSGLAVAAATDGNRMSNDDVDGKRALQAAEAGLQTALYRINMLQPAADRCVTDAVVDPVAGRCPEHGPEALGNGASFSYRTSVELPAGSGCAGMPVQAQTALSQRCVTATGNVHGVVRRVQTRIASYAATPLFPVAGLLGLERVDLSGNVRIDTPAATNGVLSMNGNVDTAGVVLGPAGSSRRTGNVSSGPIVQRTAAQGPFVLAAVDPGNSATVNDDQRIANGLRTPPQPPFDTVTSQSGLSFDPATRALRSTGNTTLTLGGGVYNFCSISISGNFTVVVAPGARVSLYVDSPDDPNSGCPAGSGGVSVTGNFASGSATGDPTSLQLYLYGTNDGLGRLTINGNATLNATVYAPRTNLVVAGNARIRGGIAARSVTMSGNGFQWDERAGGLQTGSRGIYYRTAWRECTPRPTGSDPASGC